MIAGIVRAGAIALVPAALLLVPVGAPAQGARFVLELEGGATWQTRNDVQIPNDETATRFSLADLGDGGATPAGRLTATWNVAPRHAVFAVAAPLTIEESGIPAVPIAFAGETFPAGQPVDATYRFNSWRAGYRYRVMEGSRASAWIGLTAKIRDAKVELRGGARTARDTDVGFVPLLRVDGDLRLTEATWLRLEADGLAGGPGRAIDASLRVGHALTDDLAVTVGYRTLEGGADVDSVYNFAWLHYAVTSLVWRIGA